MPDSTSQSRLSAAILSHFPPILRRALTSDEAFSGRVGLELETSITFGGSVTFTQTELHLALVSIVNDPATSVSVSDVEGNIWSVSTVECEIGTAASLDRSEARIVVNDIGVLSANAVKRRSDFDRIANGVNLPMQSRVKWQRRLDRGAIDEREFTALNRDLDYTPTRMAGKIAARLGQGGFNVDDLLPNDCIYYERLVGAPPDDNIELAGYVESTGSELVGQLLAWKRRAGLELALLLSSHSLFVDRIELTLLDRDDITSTYEWIAESGGLLTQIGAIEAALPVLTKFPSLTPLLERMLKKLVNNAEEPFSLASALVILVSGHIARKQVLKGKPIFWVQLACFAHAALLERAVYEAGIDALAFAQWAQEAGARWFYFHTMAQLPRAPRWLPDFASPEQLKAEYLGRLTTTAYRHAAQIESPLLRELLLEVDQNAREFIQRALPGPLEGNIRPASPLPPEFLDRMQDAMAAEVLPANAFADLVNAALVFDVSREHATIAAASLRRVQYCIQDSSEGSDRQMLALLIGLGVVAAVTRCIELAGELRILCRVTRRRRAEALPAFDEMRIALIAGAAYDEDARWAEFVGDWLSELAFEVSADQGRSIRHDYKMMAMMVPALRYTAAKGLIALRSL